MAVFTSSVLDDFNRANATPIDNGNLNYYQGIGDIFPRYIGLGRLNLASNRIQQVLASSNASWNSFWVASSFGSVECSATIASLGAGDGGGAFQVYSRGQNLGQGATPPVFRAYFLNVAHSTNNLFHTVNRSNGVSTSQLATSGNTGLTLAVGDKIGMRVYDLYGFPMVEGWYKPSAGVWGRVCAARDTIDPVYGTGYPGLGVATQTNGTWAMDDWAVGTISTPYPTLTTDPFSTLVGALPDPTGELFESSSRNGLVQANPQARPDPLEVRVQQHPAATSMTKNTKNGQAGFSVNETTLV